MRNTRKYSAAFDQEYMVKLLEIFQSSEESLTVAEINMALGGQLTSQKIVRLISKVNEIEPIIKQKGKDMLMHYKLRSKHEEQGYDVSVYTGPQNEARFDMNQHSYFNPGEKGWVAPAFRHYYDSEGNEL